MKIERAKLLDHVRALHCGGLIPQVAFSGAFAATAAAPDNAALVVTGGIDGIEPLSEPIGLQDLSRLIWALGLGRSEHVEVSTVRDRLLLQLGGPSVALLTCDPELVTTWVESDLVEAVVEQAAADGDGFEVPSNEMSDVRSAASELAAAGKHQTPVATFVTGPEKAGFRFGASSQDQAIVPLPGVVTEYEEERRVHAGPLGKILAQVDRDVRLWPGASESFLTIRSAGFTYYVTPIGGDE